MASEKSRELAAQVWCRPEASHVVMDCELAEAFANTLDELKERVNCSVMRGVANLPSSGTRFGSSDASDFIRIQAAAGIEPLYGSRQ